MSQSPQNPLAQFTQPLEQLQSGLNVFQRGWGLFTGFLDFAWNVAIMGGLAWLAYTFLYPMLPDSWRRGLEDTLSKASEAFGNSGLGASIMPMIGQLISMVRNLMNGKLEYDPALDPIRNAFLSEDAAKFEQRVGNPVLARIFGSREMRGFLYDNGITPATALQADKAKLLINRLSGNDLMEVLTALRTQGTPEDQAKTARALQTLLADRDVPLQLLNKLSTAQLNTLFTGLLSQGTAEQQEATKRLVNDLLARPDILRTINEKHPDLIRQFASQTIGAGNGLNAALIKEKIATPDGLEFLRIAAGTIPIPALTQMGISSQQVQQIVADIKANNPNGQAYRTLINNDMLPLIGQIMPRLSGGASVNGALEILRNPEVRAKLADSSIVGAVAQLAPQNAFTRLLFTHKDEQDGRRIYPNIEATIALSNFVRSGNEVQQTQRRAAVAAIDALRVSGSLPAEGTAERANLQTFLGDAENRNAMRDYISKLDISTLDSRAQQAQLINLIRGIPGDEASQRRGDTVMRLLADPVAVKWLEEQNKAGAQSAGTVTPSAPLLSVEGIQQRATELGQRAQNKITNFFASYMSTQQTVDYIRNHRDVPQIIKDNAEAVVALRAAMKASPQQLSSLETPRDMAAAIAAVSQQGRTAGITNATTSIGGPEVQQLAALRREQEAAQRIAG